MNTRTITIGNIVSQIKKLEHLKKINLLEKVVSLIKNESVERERISLFSINGLGSEIWRETDIDRYVENERQCVSTPFFGQSKLDFSPLITTIIKKWECGKLSAEG